eukprot:CAMPEP_0177669698 /NCGR_PEP_ID=MMETSP0447-20121125/23619_1 /TAXON_ID=0 /ORGANISM="Stygamoeba regulata, Strain BSH-02190019" /LENGTH=45 /DNA_ID= /DNA_START= /DNA_END= /DNA_ORIENTATION=
MTLFTTLRSGDVRRRAEGSVCEREEVVVGEVEDEEEGGEVEVEVE